MEVDKVDDGREERKVEEKGGEAEAKMGRRKASTDKSSHLW